MAERVEYGIRNLAGSTCRESLIRHSLSSMRCMNTCRISCTAQAFPRPLTFRLEGRSSSSLTGYLQMTAILALRQYNHVLSPRMDKLLTRLLLDIRAQMTPSRIKVRRRRTSSGSNRKSVKKNGQRFSRRSAAARTHRLRQKKKGP